MPQLVIRQFSCIEEAAVELRPITVLIGPQASGKSVITKLWFFFNNSFSLQLSHAEAGESYKAFTKALAKKFTEWFPPGAWGRRPFEIVYTAGPVEIHVRRKQTTRKLHDDVEVELSAFMQEQHARILDAFQKVSRKKKDDEFTIRFSQENWKVQDTYTRNLKRALGSEYIDYQIFVPAGRSFFTNLGKAFAILEHGSQLDEMTKTFGRLFSYLLDGHRVYYGDKPSQKVRDFLSAQKAYLSRIFGGEINLSESSKHVDTDDGRKIPLSVLSSGQQELLPLILIIQHFTQIVALERPEKRHGLLYIEEPEAHLFPSAQGALTKHLAEVAKFTAPLSYMLITTHSPYVLSQLNILIKSATVAGKGSDKVKGLIADVVDSRYWLPPAMVAAYAIEDAKLRSVKDDSGLIDGQYLDAISAEISTNFMELLGVEALDGEG